MIREEIKNLYYVFTFSLKTFKASLCSSEKHIIINRQLALKVFKLDKHLRQHGLLKIKCFRATPSNDFIFNNPIAIGLYVLQKIFNVVWHQLKSKQNFVDYYFLWFISLILLIILFGPISFEKFIPACNFRMHK